MKKQTMYNTLLSELNNQNLTPSDYIPLTNCIEYKITQEGKGVTINSVQYKVTSRVKNSGRIDELLRAATEKVIKNKNGIFEHVKNKNASEENSIYYLYDNMFYILATYLISPANLLLYIDDVNEEEYANLINFTYRYCSNLANTIWGLRSEYANKVSNINEQARLNKISNDISTAAQIDSAPKFATIMGDIRKNWFDTYDFFGNIFIESSLRGGDIATLYAKNVTTENLEKFYGMSNLKRTTLINLNNIVEEFIKNFYNDMISYIMNELTSVFDPMVFHKRDLKHRPYDKELWKEEIFNIPPEDVKKFKILCSFYKIEYTDLFEPAFKRIIEHYKQTGDFNYTDKDIELYKALNGVEDLGTVYSLYKVYQSYLDEKLEEETQKLIEKGDCIKISDAFKDIEEEITNNTFFENEYKEYAKKKLRVARNKLLNYPHFINA